MRTVFARIIIALAAMAMFTACADIEQTDIVTGASLRAVSVALGDAHSCAPLSDGLAECWGRNNIGQLGNTAPLQSLVPVEVAGLASVVEMTGGGAHTCARLSDGTLRCWGDNSSGQLGNASDSSSTAPVAPIGITSAVSVSAGGDHTCAVVAGGAVMCWGSNSSSQLGNGTTASSSTPVQVSSITNAASVSAGGNHTCAFLNDGTARCWGENAFGQLGNGAIINSGVPVAVQGLTGATQVSAGANHTCAVVSNGTIECWGDNTGGQLGVSWTLISLSPLVEITVSTVPVTAASSSITTATSVAAGGDYTCATVAEGRVRCWGENAFGQLGNGSTIGFDPPGIGASSTSTIVPVSASGVTNATSVDAGLFHSCARISDSSVKCWVENSYGQLGDGSGIDSLTPVSVE